MKQYTSSVISLFMLTIFLLVTQSSAQTSFHISSQTSGDTLFTIDNSGNVGIGLRIPAARLDIAMTGNGAWQRGLRILNPDMITNDGLLLVLGRSDDLKNMGYMSFKYDNDASDYNRLSFGLYGVNNVLNVSGNGGVSIGTAFPLATLDVRGTDPDYGTTFSIGNSNLSHQLLLFPGRENDPNPFIRWTAGDPLRFSTDEGGWSEKMRISAEGNVGIGTETPGQLLEVAGTIHSTSGGFMFPDGSVQSVAAVSSAGNTLDQAYDQGGAGAGAVINADAGAVGISGPSGLWVNGFIHGYGSLGLSGGGTEGGQLSFFDGDGEGAWEIDNFGDTGNELLRFFRGRGYNDIFNAFVIGTNGNIGIGTIPQTEKLTVLGTVHSTSGGFRFPDGTIQTTASGGGGASEINDLSDGKTGGNSVFLGSGAGANDDGSTNNNTAVGTDALNATTTGSYNAALGHGALQYNTTGERNVGVGQAANMRNQAGSNNTAIGYAAGGGSSLHSKSGNVFIGYMAGVYESGDNKLYIENSDSDTPLIGGDFATDQVDLNGEVYVRNRLGVGTTTPGAGLHLVGSGFPNSFLYLESQTGGDAGIRIYEGSTDKWHIFNNVTLNGLQIYNDLGQTAIFADQTTTFVGIGTTNPTSMLTVAGTAECDVLEINGGSDIAEPFDIIEKDHIKPGMVMTIDADHPGKLKISDKAYDRCVAGIISGAGGINPGMIMGQSGTVADGEYPVALTGRVYCWVDASTAPIKPGDLLTTADLPGHAMKVQDYNKSQGAVLGKAMGSLEKGQGLILMLVSLQ